MLNKLAKAIHADNVAKGFYDNPRSPLELHMLIVSEIAEATEEARKDAPDYYETDAGKPCGEAVEIADALIRILDYAAHRNWNLDQIVELKLAYNRTRPYRHGGKKF